MITWRDDERVTAALERMMDAWCGCAISEGLTWEGCSVHAHERATAYAEAVASAVLAEQPCEVWADRHRKCMDEEHFSGPCDCRCGPCRSRAERAKRKEAP